MEMTNRGLAVSSIGETGPYELGEQRSINSTPLHSQSSIPVYRGRHEWYIEDFLQRTETSGVALESRFPLVVTDQNGCSVKTGWRIKMYPKGCDTDHPDHISIFINQVVGPGPIWVRYSISLMGLANRVTYTHVVRRGTVLFDATHRSSCRGWKKFFPRSTILNPASNLLHDGALLIRANLEVHCRFPNPVDDIDMTMDDHNPSISSESNSVRFSEMKYTDVTLACGDREFKCHKFMLARFSDVFDAMFSHDFREANSGRVIIEDLTEESVKEMIRFIYTYKVHNMPRVCRDLLAAADKYNIVKLKTACIESLSATMNVETISSLLIYADERNFTDLKSKAIEFICLNVEAVTKSAGWQDLAKVPALMTEILLAMRPRATQ